jgi:hypothetical protein
VTAWADAAPEPRRKELGRRQATAKDVLTPDGVRVTEDMEVRGMARLVSVIQEHSRDLGEHSRAEVDRADRLINPRAATWPKP